MDPPQATVGSLAPAFDLPCTPAGRASLADYRGRWLMLIFYPRDFSLVCPTELSAISARIDQFNRQGCGVLGISSDSIESHLRWIGTPKSQGGLGGLKFPLASDTDGRVCRSFGVFLEHQHVALRGLFIIDPNGVLQYQVVHNTSVGRRTDELLRVLAALQTGGLCAENWSPEQAPMDAAGLVQPGSMISHYRIERHVGDGAFATVFQAQDTTLLRMVAIKVVKATSPMAPGAVLAEARAAAALNHPNVCTIYSVDDSEGVPVIAMEYLSGTPLSRLVGEERLSGEAAAGIVRQVAAGMAAAHALGVVHGDLKPANVMITDEGVAKILDFGLARRERPQANPDETTDLGSPSSGVTGTPSYMSPEQADGQPPTAASDVFSLGAILYEMLTGRRAFAGDNVLRVLSRIRSVDAKSLAADVDEPFSSLLREALVREPERRTIGMSQIGDRMAAVLNPSSALAG
ncbi:MAG: redoxin domain-containing protein [Pirellulales bacterium]